MIIYYRLFQDFTLNFEIFFSGIITENIVVF